MTLVLLPLDYLDEIWPEKLRGARIGALLHPASGLLQITITQLRAIFRHR